jgi:BirA family biotin operon repressor/biotin-[acetyl-CoA-carboxylase] ligase
MATPYVTLIRNVVASTQDLAAERFDATDVPVLVVAGRQTAGRGRSGNDWWQAVRAVAASLAFSPDMFPVEDSFSLAVGLAVRDAIGRVCAVAVNLKWPNDIVLGAAKVAGVLVERSDERVVVGCGINLYWPEPPDGACGLFDADPGPTLGETLSEAWASRIIDTEGHWDRAAYVAACTTIGADITWQPTGRGTVVTVDDIGGLVVETDTGRVTLRSGEVTTIRPAH